MIVEKEVKQTPLQIKRASLEKPNKTRTAKPKIDLKICEKNYDCIVFCPRNAISMNKNEYPVIDNNLCDGCLICLRVCPATAIKEESE